MKKTLFIALLATMACGGAQATVDAVSHYSYDKIWVDQGEVLINKDNVNDYLDHGTFVVKDNTYLEIGTKVGEGTVTIVGDGVDGTPVVVNASNRVLIGGPGLNQTGAPANNGTLNVSNGAVFRVAPDLRDANGNLLTTPSSAGAGMNIGTSGTASKGWVNLNNATLHANCNLEVGGGVSQGFLKAENGSHVVVEATSNLTDVTGVNIIVARGAGSTGNITLDGGSSMKLVPHPGVNNLAYIGLAGRGSVSVQNGSSFDLSGTSYTFIGQAAGSDGTIAVGKDSTFTTAGSMTAIGYLGAGSVSLVDGGTMNVVGQVALGYAAGGHGTLSVSNGGTLNNYNSIFANLAGEATFDVGEKAVINNYGYINLKDEFQVGKNAVVDNYRQIISTAGMSVAEGATVNNYGTLKFDGDITLGSGSTLNTGYVYVSNQTDRDGDELWDGDLTFINGLAAKTEGNKTPSIKLAEGAENVVVGAWILGDGYQTQHLDADEYQAINDYVQGMLGVYGAGVKVSSIIGDYVELEYSGDVFKHDTKLTVDGGNVTVTKAGSSAPVTGTIGSYEEDRKETAANIGVNANATAGTVCWGNERLETVSGEDTVIRTNVDLTEGGTLVVVAGSKLDLQGKVDGKIEVDGTLKGKGTVNGAVKVNEGGALIVGNSPGKMTVEDVDLDGALDFSLDDVASAATDTAYGWGSHTYSQLVLSEGHGVINFDEHSTINIILGGNMFQTGVISREVELDLDLITGITSLTCTLAGDELTVLKGKTTFSIADPTMEPGSITAEPGYVGFSIKPEDWHYELVDAGNGTQTLKLKGTITVPEPATATLSLLAFAALCARRRRK